MSFIILFDSYKSLLIKKDFEEKKESSSIEENDSSITWSDIQSATKKIFNIAVQQNTETLNKVSFYDTISRHFLSSSSSSSDNNNNNNNIECSPLLAEIGWDLLTELFLLYSVDNRFCNFLFSICYNISPRELSIMFSEVFSHPILSIAATHDHYQLHTMQNHYILNDIEDNEQQKQMKMNLNISKQAINLDASDDILSFHKNINYIKIQTVFIKCIIILFHRLTKTTTSKYAINHFYQSLIPTAILHFQTLSKELSYQFYLHNVHQYHTHHTHQSHSHHDHGHIHGRKRSLSSDSINALDATKKQRQDWLVNSKNEYEIYIKEVYKLFALMVNNHCDLQINDNNLKDVPVDINQLIQSFQPQNIEENGEEEDDEKIKEEKIMKSKNFNTLWLARYGFGVLSGVYWWYNVFFLEDVENDGDVNNDSADIIHNIKKPAYNIFMSDIVDGLKREILVKLCHSVGMNGNVLLSLCEYLNKLENKLESEKPWHLNSDQAILSKSNPSTPTPVLQPMSSIGHPDLNTIVEEQEDIEDIGDMMDITDNNKKGVIRTASISERKEDENKEDEEDENEEDEKEKKENKEKDENEDKLLILNGVKEDEEFNNNNNNGDDDGGWDDNDDDINFDDIDASKLKKMQETQALVDELKEWSEYMDIFGVSCYYHSLWVLLQSDDCIENGAIKFKRNSKHIWKCIQLLFEQLTTLPAGIEFGEFILNITIGKMCNNDLVIRNKKDLNKLLNTAQFHEQGLWALVQFATGQLKGIHDRALHQKLWQFIVHLINAADLKTRFQCIVSTALQCPIPVVQSLMFTELKNQIFNNWNIDLEEEEKEENKEENKENEQEEEEQHDDDNNNNDDDDVMMMMEDTLNPFCSRQVVMVLVQRLGKELQNMTLDSIYGELDSLNACLNLCRFILTKDKDTNYTQIYDDDCPLRPVIKTLFNEMTKIGNDDENNNDDDNDKHEIHDELEQFQRQMMKNQFLVSLDLVKRILEMYK